MFKYFRMAWEEAKKQKALDKQKARLLNKDMDYAFLEELIQKMNENPKLRIKVVLRDGTTLDINTAPKVNTSQIMAPVDDFLEVR